nr:hypothetical protein [uncultured Undibacterium sp.]
MKSLLALILFSMSVQSVHAQATKPLTTEQSYSDKLVTEVVRLYPSYITNPLDVKWNHGNATVLIIEPDGSVKGHIFGSDKEIGQKSFQVAARKVLQVWRTGYATGRFEELVYAGKLDEGIFGVQRPDFVGWPGGVPLLTPDGKIIAAGFSGFRGVKDVEILERAAEAIGLHVKWD